MGLSVAETRKLNEIAALVAKDDPDYSRRMASFGGYEGSVLGLPARWTLVPVILAGALMVIGFFAATVIAANSAEGSGAADKAPAARLHR
ncbi:DUF3040 domain-containing protein [Actinomadura barringtoniae]|uniref:DUF3040 domain-containing protein n=1 Tax=Actinomadura barringtoniae TaxID=1427535 RepID=A0A939PHR1_9ACTN|nr:DUF3040 domain-containing protein [Actinomadura barringtoniae]MBO2450014.1 DUF3040 domain-containing protein [Actinomadura barringtoniae]